MSLIMSKIFQSVRHRQKIYQQGIEANTDRDDHLSKDISMQPIQTSGLETYGASLFNAGDLLDL